MMCGGGRNAARRERCVSKSAKRARPTHSAVRAAKTVHAVWCGTVRHVSKIRVDCSLMKISAVTMVHKAAHDQWMPASGHTCPGLMTGMTCLEARDEDVAAAAAQPLEALRARGDDGADHAHSAAAHLWARES